MALFHGSIDVLFTPQWKVDQKRGVDDMNQMVATVTTVAPVPVQKGYLQH